MLRILERAAGVCITLLVALGAQSCSTTSTSPGSTRELRDFERARTLYLALVDVGGVLTAAADEVRREVAEHHAEAKREHGFLSCSFHDGTNYKGEAMPLLFEGRRVTAIVLRMVPGQTLLAGDHAAWRLR